MPIPDYQTLMLPVLEVLSDGRERRMQELREALATQFGLTEAERGELLPSGRQATFDNRVGWAKTYLSHAGLLESPGRGTVRIAQRGLDVLQSRPARIDNKFLRQFAEFRAFQRIAPDSGEVSPKPDTSPTETDKTPEEILEEAYLALRRDLSQEILDRVRNCSPQFFERLVVDVLLALGYGGSRSDAGRAIGQSGDEGIDGMINEDRLGLEAVYIQAKRWEGTVGRPIVQAFSGSLDGQRAKKGILITTSRFSPEAHEYVRRIEKKIVLIDGEMLSQLMIDSGVGVSEAAVYTVKRIDQDYFEQ